MAGPIIEALQNMRQNRHRGRPLITTLLRFGQQPPVTYQEAMESVQDYVPDELKETGPYSPNWRSPQRPAIQQVSGESEAPKPAFSSLSGGRSARQDYKGRPGLKYPARMLANDADAPDLDYSRTDSIDGRDPIQRGETDSLPSPDYPSLAHRRRAEALDEIAALGKQMANQTDHRALIALQSASANAKFRHDTAEREIAMAEQRSKGGLDFALQELEPALQRALSNGRWPEYEAAVRMRLAADLKDDQNVPFDTQQYMDMARRNAQPAIYSNLRDTLYRHNGFPSAEDPALVPLIQSLVFAHPFKPNNPNDLNERSAYVQQVRGVLTDYLNPGRKPAVDEYITALALKAAHVQSPWKY